MIRKILSCLLSFVISVSGGIPALSGYRVWLTVHTMTLEQKVGQMIMPAFRTWEDDGSSVDVTELNDDIRSAVKKYGFGGVILFSQNCKGTEQTTRLIDDFQNCAVDGIAGMKMFIGVDQEGGYVTRLATGCYTCGNMALGALNSSSDTETIAKIMGSELRAEGFNVDFAPDMDINNNPSNPVIGIRSFSSSASIVSDMGKAYIEGLHSENIMTASKHFPGHGDTSTDSHTGLPKINNTYDELNSTELVPFRAAVEAGTDFIMTAHIQYPQIEKETYTSATSGEEVYLPATLSKTIITGILREDIGFDGVVTTDAMNMDAIAQNFNSYDAAVLAINAGVDMLLMPVTVTKKSDITELEKYIANIVDAVNSGDISEKLINNSVTRILKLKLKYGLLDEESKNISERVAEAKKVVGCKKHHETEFTVAEKAVTLLKNDGDMLPLKAEKNKKVLILYPYEDDKNSITYAIQRLSKSVPGDYDECIITGCYRYSSANYFEKYINEAENIVVLSEAYSKKYLDPTNKSGWQSEFIDILITLAHSKNKKVALVSLQLPYDTGRYTDADAVLVGYGCKGMSVIPENYNGELQGYGVNMPASICVLFNEVSPQGKLPVTVYKTDKNYNYTDEIVYSIGSGLSY